MKVEKISDKQRKRKYLSVGIIGQNTKKSPGHLRRLAVTQTPVKNIS